MKWREENKRFTVWIVERKLKFDLMRQMYRWRLVDDKKKLLETMSKKALKLESISRLDSILYKI